MALQTAARFLFHSTCGRLRQRRRMSRASTGDSGAMSTPTDRDLDKHRFRRWLRRGGWRHVDRQRRHTRASTGCCLRRRCRRIQRDRSLVARRREAGVGPADLWLRPRGRRSRGAGGDRQLPVRRRAQQKVGGYRHPALRLGHRRQATGPDADQRVRPVDARRVPPRHRDEKHPHRFRLHTGSANQQRRSPRR
jgi:hypothetical protein